MNNRIKCAHAKTLVTTAQNAAMLIKDGMAVGTSGFTMAGYPKIVPLALADLANSGEEIKITLITGASVGEELDGALSRAGVISRRYPYQTNNSIRDEINKGKIAYADMHLSNMPFYIKQGYFGNIDIAIVEAVGIDENGNIIPSTSVGCTNTLVECADKVIVEINTSQPIELAGFHDIYSPKKFPNTEPIPLTHAGERIGMPFIHCPKEKLAAIVECDIPDSTRPSCSVDANSKKMAKNLLAFLENEQKAGRLPEKLPPLQSGVGAVANAVLSGLLESDFTGLSFYSEVLQDSVLDLIDAGKIEFASGTALTLSPEKQKHFNENIEKYRGHIILRPEEISNSPEIIRRLGVISINTALEADLSGNVNSTHIKGVKLINGIGGSGDFTRNAAISIFTTASTAKNGLCTCIVPFVSHVDHTEHDVCVIISEQGVADLRCLTAYERADKIIANCAHPNYKKQLWDYANISYLRSDAKHGIAPNLFIFESGGIIRH